MNRNTYIFTGILFLMAVIFFGFLFQNHDMPNYKDLLLWSLLTIVVESFLVILPNSKTSVSVGYSINIAAIIIGGPLLGAMTACLGLLFRIPNIPERGYVHLLNNPIGITIYNISQSAVVTSTIGLIYIYTNGKIGDFSLIQTILIMALGGILNSITISIFMSLLGKKSIIKIWITNVKRIFPNSIAVGSIGIVISLAYIGYGYGAVILFLGPLLLLIHSYKLHIDSTSLYFSSIQAFNSVMEAKDPYTSGHSTRVERYAVKLAEAYGLPSQKVQNIRNASILHDIGKIGINDNILNKPGKLTKDEYEIIMKHPTIGAEIINKVDVPKNISEIVKYHHERFDGKGYPEGISGNSIPIESCIIAIADSYDAMTSDRPYRSALNEQEAIKEIKNNAGLQFHPELATMFIRILNSNKGKTSLRSI